MKKLLCLIFLFGSLFSFSQRDVFELESSLESQYYPIKKGHKWYFSNSQDSVMLLNKYFDTIHFCSSQYYPTCFLAVNGINYEFFDSELNTITTGKLVNFSLDQNNLYIQWQKDWKRYDFTKNELTTFRADSIFTLNELTYIYSDKKIGVITDKAFIEPRFYRLCTFGSQDLERKNPLLLTMNNGKYGLITHDGKVLIPEVASIIQEEKYNVIKYKEGHWKYLFPDSYLLDPKECEVHLYLNNGYKIYSKDRQKSLLYVNHKPVEKTSLYDDIFPNILKGIYFVRKENKIGLLNVNFVEIVKPFCDQIDFIGNGSNYNGSAEGENNALKFLVGDKWGVVDLSGRVLIEAKYDNILEIISYGNAIRYKVAMHGKVGLINEKSETVLPFVYDNFVKAGDGYVTDIANKIGYLDLNGIEVLPNTFLGFNANFAFGGTEGNRLIIFREISGYKLLNGKAEILFKEPCKDYAFSNDMLKCYYDDRIEVHALENNEIVETTVYQNINSASLNKIQKGFGSCGGFSKSYLELNQQTGLFAARNNLYAGFGLKPTYTHTENSIFGDYFEACQIQDTSFEISYRNFPDLTTYNVYNWMNCSNGLYFSTPILSTDIFKNSYMSFSSTDVFVLEKNKKMEWLTSSSKDPMDLWIAQNGITYVDKASSAYQKIFAGGQSEIVPLIDADVSIIDYFNFINRSNNLWFSNLESAALIMSPNIGVKFENCKFGLRDVRTLNRVGFNKNISSFKSDEYWNFSAYKKSGQSTWCLVLDLDDKEPKLENVYYFTVNRSIYQEFVIIEKIVDNSLKKGLFTSWLEPMTEIIYDEIIFAGQLGFLVRLDSEYFYLDEFGEKVK